MILIIFFPAWKVSFWIAHSKHFLGFTKSEVIKNILVLKGRQGFAQAISYLFLQFCFKNLYFGEVHGAWMQNILMHPFASSSRALKGYLGVINGWLEQVMRKGA